MDFIQEVQDELKQERSAAFFKRYGVYLLAIAIGVVLATIVSTWWSYHSHQKRVDGAEAYYMATEALENETNPKSAAMEAIAKQGGGYAALAGFTLAQRAIDDEKYAEAFARYQAIVAQHDDRAVSDLAELQAIRLQLTKEGVGEIKDIDGALKRLAQDDAPYVLSARELQIIRLLEAGKEAEAREIMQWMTTHPAYGVSIKERLDILLPSTNPFGIDVADE